jgi:deoxycytidylate deaminase
MTNAKSTISGPNPVFEGAELVFGLVAPAGTNFNLFQNPLKSCLKRYKYRLNAVRVSDLIKKFGVSSPNSKTTGTIEYVRLNEAMHNGNQLRLSAKRGEILALAAAGAIHSARPKKSKDQALRNCAHVIRSLKHPEEVRALRRIYGNGFFLIGLIVDESQRRKYLTHDLGCTDPEVNQLLKRDEHEEDPQYFGLDGRNYGQRTRDTFHLADAFLSLEDDAQLQRFIGLVFGSPYVTPTRDEHAMLMAFASALRSADLSRQVGAVIVSAQNDLIATGANDAPRATGGLYWPGKDDQRDYVLQKDTNEERRNEIVNDVLQRLSPKGSQAGDWVSQGKKKLKGSPLMDITEYGRAVHAEMEALLSCARTGCSPVAGTLYSTTFPCHNCAKHIVDSGVMRVVYVEPYPKSQALTLFSDSIRLHDQPTPVTARQRKRVQQRVTFEPFQGIGTRRFFDLFSMALSSGQEMVRKKAGKTVDWKPLSANVRVPLLPNCYIDREILATKELLELTSPPRRRR